jgi:hypothetical protein
VAQKPIQILSEKSRVTLNNDLSLDNELVREFGHAGPVVAQWLEELRVQGENLENSLWENGGLPWPSLRAKARFKFLCMRRKINWSALDAPISRSFGPLPEPAIAFVTDLLQGLALQKTLQLSRAQAALLWAQALRPENLKESDFSALLSKRFDQFHGLKVQLEELEAIDFNGSRWTGGKFKDGGQFKATTFLLGDTRWIDRFKQGKTEIMPSPQVPRKQKTSPLDGQLSSLLASRIICGGEVPLQLAVEEKENQLYGLIVSAGGATEEQLRHQLEPALPFADYDLSAEDEPLSQLAMPDPSVQRLRLSNLPLRVGTNLYCADSGTLIPEMGAAGAALLGWTLMENLSGKHKQGEE